MGILDRTDPQTRVVRISDLNIGNDLVYQTNDDASSIASESTVILPPSLPKRYKKVKNFSIGVESKQCRGKRAFERQTQLSFVKSLVGIDELSIKEEISWTPDYGKTVFTSLFLEEENMRAWNRFLEMEEEEQKKLMLEKDDPRPPSTSEGKAEKQEGSKPNEDKRNVHPFYCSEECFSQINHRIRNLLNKRHLPLGLVESLEIELRQHFQQFPLSQYEPDVLSGFGRLVIHAVTQYLGLFSKSYDCSNRRKIVVINKKPAFIPPPNLLAEYLEWKASRH